ncbi:DUF6783 domain-containing protein [Enterocloster sp. OA13]
METRYAAKWDIQMAGMNV